MSKEKKLMDLESFKDFPDKLSSLLENAMRDLEAVEKDPKFRVNMLDWVFINRDKTCIVCLAGAYLTKSVVKIPDSDTLEDLVDKVTFNIIDDMYKSDRDPIWTVMDLIDDLRVGRVADSVRKYESVLTGLGRTPSSGDITNLPHHFEVKDYHANPVKFKEDMGCIIKILKSRNF